MRLNRTTTLLLLTGVLSTGGSPHAMAAINTNDVMRYIREKRWITKPWHPRSADLREELNAEITRLLDLYDDGGHVEPAYFSIGITGSWILYGYPGEQAYVLADALPFLPSNTQARLKAYLYQEIREYDPTLMGFEHCDGGWGSCEMTGNRREYFRLPASPNPEPIVPNLWPPPTVPPEALYMIWRYCNASGDWGFISSNAPPTGERWDRLVTLFHSISNPPVRYGHIAAAIGFARLLDHYGMTNSSLFTSAVARVYAGMVAGTNFNLFLERSYDAFLQGPHDWGWTPFHYLRHQNAVGAMIAPEIGRFLREYALTNVYRRVTYNPNEGQPGENYAIESVWQGWYLTRGHYIPLIPIAGYYGENHMVTPDTPWALFMTHAWIYNESGDELRRWLDVPYCIGDLFHIQKLTATISAYGQPVWSQWQPPEVHIGAIENGSVKVTVRGQAGARYVLERSTDLRIAPWLPLITNTGPTFLWLPQPDMRQEIYRAITVD